MSKKYIEARRQAQRKRDRNILITAIVVVLVASITILLSASPPWVISAYESKQKISDGAFLLDVRQPEEYQEAYIPGAYLIPLDELEERIDEVPEEKEIVIYCRTGNRSKDAYRILSKAGYANVTSIDGGIYAWAQEGYEIDYGQ